MRKGFILFSYPHGRDTEVLPTVHLSVKAAVDFSLRGGGQVFRPLGDEDHWTGPVRRAIETDSIEGGDSHFGPRLEYVVVRDGGNKTDVNAIRPCEVEP